MPRSLPHPPRVAQVPAPLSHGPRLPVWQRGAEKALDPLIFRSWIRPLEIVFVEDGLAVLSAPSRLHAEWSQIYFGPVILRSLRAQYRDVTRIEITVVPRLGEEENPEEIFAW